MPILLETSTPRFAQAVSGPTWIENRWKQLQTVNYISWFKLVLDDFGGFSGRAHFMDDQNHPKSEQKVILHHVSRRDCGSAIRKLNGFGGGLELATWQQWVLECWAVSHVKNLRAPDVVGRTG